MTSFSTEFPIDSKNTIAGVLRLACGWLTGSPHTKFTEADFHEIPESGERNVTVGIEHVTLAHSRTVDQELGGLRYERTEDGLAWTTSIVTLKTQEKHLLSVQVVCEALSTAVRLPPPKKPYFIRQALTELGGGSDGEIPVADKPFLLSAGEETIAAALILGTANNTLPIVYVSAGFKDTHLINPIELAKYVSGMAHVVVEPNRPFSHRVKILTKSRNVYGGTIGVYWPQSEAKRAYFLREDASNPRTLAIEVSKDIRIALSNRRPRTNCTWVHLKETIARTRLEELKASGSTALEEYVAAFDAELAAKQALVTAAEHEINRLTAEVRRLSVSEQTASGGLLQQGEEHDLYEHEIKDIVLSALQEAIRASREGSRRQHIFRDLLGANIDSGARQRIADEIKTLFKTYRDMDSKIRSALARLGFDLSEDGKHYKAIYQGDSRYTFTLPKTSGDHRAGKNMASDINNTLF